MGFQGVTVPVKGTPTLLFQPTVAGQALVQNQGTIPVTLGGPAVSFAAGVQLPANSLTPVPVNISRYGSIAESDDGLYAVSNGGTVNIAATYPV